MEIGLGLEITLIGMVVVFSTLLVLMGVVTIPRLLTSLFNKKQEVLVQVEEEPIADIPPQHLAAIAAAVAMMGESYRVKAIEVLGNDNWERSRYTEITSL